MTAFSIRSTTAALALGGALVALPAVALAATATLKNADGDTVGTIALTETPDGVLIKGELTDISPGEHAFHIHETGQCEPPFESAGGHFNPDDDTHGYMTEDGPHAGDMPNIFVPDSGELTFQVYNDDVSVTEKNDDGYLFDEDGSAFVIHAGADDYKSQPAGDAGNRIACGVIEK